MNPLLLGSRWLIRSLKRGDYLWLWLAIVLASASVTVIEQLTQAVQATMQKSASQSLGADLVLRSTQPIDSRWEKEAQAIGLNVVRSQKLMTMIHFNQHFQLVQLTALADNNTLGIVFSSPDDAVLSQTLAEQTGLQVGQPLEIGNRALRIQAIIEQANSLDALAEQFAPVIYIHLASLPTLGLTGTGSRITEQWQLNGKSKIIDQFTTQLNAQHNAAWQVVTASSANDDINQTLNTATLFLTISALVCLLVAGLAILIASRFYFKRWTAQLTLLRALGTTQTQLTLIFMGQQLTLSVLASALGVLLGAVFFHAITPWLIAELPQFTLGNGNLPLLVGMMSGTVVFWVFALPNLMQVLASAPNRLLRSNPNQRQALLPWLVSMALLLGLIVLLLPVALVGWAVVAIMAVSGLLWGLASVMQRLLHRLQPHTRGWLRLTLASLNREPHLIRLQFTTFGLVLYLLLFMTFVQQQLLTTWQTSLPAQAANTFIINVQPEQADAISQQLRDNGITAQAIPMMRARLMARNDSPLSAALEPNQRTKRLLQREANMAILPQPPADNRILAEQSVRQHPDLPTLSVDSGIAQLFHIQLGDVLHFSVAGQNQAFEVTQLRQVHWQTLQANFFFMAQPWQGNDLPVTLLYNFYNPLDEQQTLTLKSTLKQQAAGIIWIDTQAMIQQVQHLMQQAGFAVSLLYGFTLLASLIVMMSAILASQQARLKQWLVLKTLGASHGLLLGIGMAEFLLIGLLAGVLAALLAQISSNMVGSYWLDQPWTVNPTLWLTSVGISCASLLLMALLSQWHYLGFNVKKMAQRVD